VFVVVFMLSQDCRHEDVRGQAVYHAADNVWQKSGWIFDVE